MANNKKRHYGKNLLRNSSAQKDLEHWEILKQGGDGFHVEKTPSGSKPLSEFAKYKSKGCCWATSYKLCEKRQIVDVKDAGYGNDLMDQKKPPIRVREWYSARYDCGCEYHISVRLLNAGKEELDKWEFSDVKEAGSDWCKASHTFSDYGPGVRFIEYTHGGKDTKNWAGHYGVKITGSSVVVAIEDQSPTFSPSSDDEDKAGDFCFFIV